MNNDPVAKSIELGRRAAALSALKPVSLPEWPESKRGTPNTFLRSALFSAVQSKDRLDFKKEVLASQAGIIVTYTGQQLNQEDLTVWETLVHLSREEPMETVCEFTAYEILKVLKLPDNGDSYDRLHDTIIRLVACAVEIRHAGSTYTGSLIYSSIRDDETKFYRIQLSRDLIKLYGKTEWTAVNWEQRSALRRKPLALALHGYFSTHKKPYPIKIETLLKFSGSRNKILAGFKQKLIKALDELVKIGFLIDYKIDNNDLVTVTKYDKNSGLIDKD
jgi:hypothetical protein